MNLHRIKLLLPILMGVFLYSCEVLQPEAPGAEVFRQDGKIFIMDQVGKTWDITHAVEKYGFDPAVFRHGLGPNAIRPIQNPQMLRPGDPGYPGSNNNGVVLGAIIRGDSRAYPLNVMIHHEIANESFGAIHVSVAY